MPTADLYVSANGGAAGSRRPGRWQPPGGRIAYGADYNPEQWPKPTWAEDVKLMAEAGVTMVSVGIFAWSKLQPAPDTYDFDWLDRVIDLLWSQQVAVCLATGTASPPPWLTRVHPEILPQRADGVRLSPGSRQHFCPSSAAYLDAALALVERLAARYGRHEALSLWHVGNEYGCHVASCYCDVSAAAFRAWLAERYHDIDGLNAAWSTTFWSQQYRDFEEILPPRASPTFANPAQQLDFARFSSAALKACFTAEADLLGRLTPGIPVTTNFLGFFKPVDSWRWAGDEDVVSLDSYPDPADPEAPIGAAMACDLTRSLGHGAPWLLMEQAPSAVNWRQVNTPKRPGLMRCWSYQALGRGADGLMSFQWRASAGGAEKFHSAMVPHAGPGSRVFGEVKALGAELARLSELAGTRVSADVAVVVDWESWWALELDSHPSRWLFQPHLLRACYEPLWRAGVPADFVHPGGDLSGYRVLVVPGLYLASEAAMERVAGFVEGGGHLLVTFFSGIVDECDRVHLGGYPGRPWRDLLGVRVEEFWPLALGEEFTAAFAAESAAALSGNSAAAVSGQSGAAGSGAQPGDFQCSGWHEDVLATDAVTVARAVSGPWPGKPVLTRRDAGRGSAWYLAAMPEPDAMQRIIALLLAAAGVPPVCPDAPPGVEVSRRSAPDASYLIICNHGAEPVDVPLAAGGHELLTDRAVDRRLTLPGLGAAVVREGQRSRAAR
jgi:beta-galactosidase